jgi:adenylate cyclase
MKFKINPVRERLFLGLLVMLLSFALQLPDVPWIKGFRQQMEWVAYDLRMRMTGSDADILDQRLVILDIDDDSLEQLGRWPWSRTRMAELIGKLNSAGAAVIALDVFFSEAERNPLVESVNLLHASGEPAYRQMTEVLAGLAQTHDADALLGKVMRDAPVVQGYAASGEVRKSSGLLPEPSGHVLRQGPDRIELAEMQSYIANIPVIGKDRPGGFLTFQPDGDGILRRVPLVLSQGEGVYPCLALAVAMEYLGLDRLALIASPVAGVNLIEAVSVEGALLLPVDRLGRVFVPFPKRAGRFHYLSAQAFLRGDHDPALLRDAIVLLGSTATGIHDLRATPVSGIYPGVEVHAALISAILEDRLPFAASWAEGVDLVTIILLGLIAALSMPFMGIGWVAVLMLFMIGAFTLINFWLWEEKRLILSLAMPIFLLGLIGLANMAIGFFHEMIFRRRLRNAFGQYIPPQLVNQLQNDSHARESLQGEERIMTVLFSDIRGFTGISENLKAEQLKQLLNRYFTPMTKIIFDWHGTIDKYVGDMIMAFWGAPVEDRDHRRHAIAAALQMIDSLDAMQGELHAAGYPSVRCGIGLNTGPMNVGDMGSEYRRAYTVLGDAVNLASRLEGLTKFYAVPIIVSGQTAEGLHDVFLFRPLDCVRVKGKELPVRIFQPVGRLDQSSQAQREEVQALSLAYTAYLAGDWPQAERLYTQLAGNRPTDRLYPIYLQRIAHLQQMGKQSGDWDGIYTHDEK